MNQIILIGRLTKDAESKSTSTLEKKLLTLV
jgi:single-stranded DNA-binding protein